MATVTWVQTRGEEEQVNARGQSGGGEDKDKTGAQGTAAGGMNKINYVWTACKCQIGNLIFIFSTFCPLFCSGSFKGRVLEIS